MRHTDSRALARHRVMSVSRRDESVAGLLLLKLPNDAGFSGGEQRHFFPHGRPQTSWNLSPHNVAQRRGFPGPVGSEKRRAWKATMFFPERAESPTYPFAVEPACLWGGPSALCVLGSCDLGALPQADIERAFSPLRKEPHGYPCFLHWSGYGPKRCADIAQRRGFQRRRATSFLPPQTSSNVLESISS